MRAISCTGSGQASQVIAGLDWVAGNYVLPAVVSMSLGSDKVDATIDAAVGTLIQLGITVVSAAGNSNAGGPVSWQYHLPASKL